MHHIIPAAAGKGSMSKNTDRWWKRLVGQKSGETRRPKPETQRLVRKALAESVKKSLPPSEVERVPADLKQPAPRHTQHAGGGHVHFFREHLLFGKTFIKKDPVTRKFKRVRRTDAEDGYYTTDGSLREDTDVP